MVALGFGGHNHHNPARTFADGPVNEIGLDDCAAMRTRRKYSRECWNILVKLYARMALRVAMGAIGRRPRDP